MKFTVLNTTGKSTSLEVSDKVFGGKVNKPLIAQAVRVYLSNQRQGTSKVKTRAEVDRTKKKWFKQKGTGNARHGARSANIFVGGGISHGPTGGQNWTLTLSKNMKKSAMMSALSSQQENMLVTTVLSDIQPKTKDAVAFLQKLAPGSKKTLVVLHESMENIHRSMKNIPTVLIRSAKQLSVYETMLADKIIFTKDAVKQLEERLAGTDTKTEIVESKPVKKEVKEKVVKEVKAVNPLKEGSLSERKAAPKKVTKAEK